MKSQPKILLIEDDASIVGGLTGVLVLCLSWTSAQSADLKLRPIAPDDNGWFRLASNGYYETDNGTNLLYNVEASDDLSNWAQIARLHRFPLGAGDYFSGSRDTPIFTNLVFTDPGSSSAPYQFYRLRAEPPDVLDWKNQMATVQDPFSLAMEGLSWVKFAISTNEPTRVYFANSSVYELHYHFVTNRIPGFSNLSQEEVDRRSQFNTNRQLYLGTVLQPWNATVPMPEYGIQFVGRDPIPPGKVLELLRLVRSAVLSAPGVLVTYAPTFEQLSSAEANRAFFETNGIPLRRAEDWIRTDTCYSRGWALGRLVFVTATNVPAAYANGTLLPTDILLTDGVPAELPYVAGIITLLPATPNSHVAILAQSYKVPFVYLADQVTRERIFTYTNQEVVLQLTDARQGDVGACHTLLFPLAGSFAPALRAELLALKQPPPLNIRRKQRFGAYTSPTTDLTPEDAVFFGGKAANFGLLRRLLPTNSPAPSLAISMDLWDDFMDQVTGDGLMLRTMISNRLAGFTYPANVATLKTELAAIRSIIRNQAQFTAQQQQAILGALSPFATNRNIRFRSSSNVEDADYFSGAGLYDSFSGCSGDDLSGNSGPSVCDPTEDGPRGVFRSIQRVYASFYNDNAFLERLRLKVNESEVGMGLLLHYSSPDDIEMANGVATVRMESNQRQAHLVTQAGAVSITNPDGDSAPEEVLAYEQPTSVPFLSSMKGSSLVLLGGHVMNWPDDYQNLASMLFRVSNAYGSGVLDFEYKKLQPGVLEVKQVREVPSQANSPLIPGYLLNEGRTFTSGSSGSDLLAMHRLKSRWTFQTRNVQFTPTNLHDGWFTDVLVEHISGDRIVTNTFATLSNLAYRVDETVPNAPNIVYSWRMNSAAGPASFGLTVARLTSFYVSPQEDPFLNLGDADFHFWLRVEYDNPVWFIGQSGTGTSEYVLMRPLQTNSAAEVVRVTHYDQGGTGPTNVTISSRYAIGNNYLYGGDPPFFRFERTEISGLTSRPLVLRGYFSQTWSGGHRQTAESFLFEPHLEEGIDSDLLQELEAKHIRMIYLLMINDPVITATNRVLTFSTRAGGPLP
ncbi:MAG TPA: PEP/pyruvate-binding domain-containing protein [Candidatus Saccharimonadales bacterium]|nr:PEP/pyruvate-binding domain-containing protein [Candidatus Saccharimonadales bacterium]